jgi:dolichol-phosphate mannosyltransferase
MPPIRLLGNTLLRFLAKAATGYWSIFDPTNGFIAVRSELLAEMPLHRIDPSYFFEISLLGQLYRVGAVVKDVDAPARYGGEISSLSIAKVLLQFPSRLLSMFLRRLALKYAIYDFSMGSVFLFVGFPLLLFGLLFGTVKWAHYSRLAVPAPTGTVMLATLSVILGVQFLLSAASVDLQSVPSEPLTHPLHPRSS